METQQHGRLRHPIFIQISKFLAGCANTSSDLLFYPATGLVIGHFVIIVAGTPGGNVTRILLNRGFQVVPLVFLRTPLVFPELSFMAAVFIVLRPVTGEEAHAFPVANNIANVGTGFIQKIAVVGSKLGLIHI